MQHHKHNAMQLIQAALCICRPASLMLSSTSKQDRRNCFKQPYTFTEEWLTLFVLCNRMLLAAGYLFRLASEEVKHGLEGLVLQELQVVPAAFL